MFGILSLSQSLAPFAGKTIWLVFAGMVLSNGISASRLSDRLANLSMKYLGHSRMRVLAGLHFIGLIAAFLVPSGVVRVLLLLPVGTALAEVMRGHKDPKLKAAVLMSLLSSTYFGGSGVLTGTVPNLVVAGQLESAAGEIVFWGEWLVWMFPIVGLARTGLCLCVIWFLFGRRLQPEAFMLERPEKEKAAPLSLEQGKILLIVTLGVVLWATDVLHRLDPAYVGLILVALYLLPLPTTEPPIKRIRNINFPFLFYIAALFSLGTGLEKSGFNELFRETITSLVKLDTFGYEARHLVITGMVVPLDFLMDIAAVAGMVMPSMLALGQSHGLAELPVAMSVAMATSLVFLPYQAAPFMVAYRLGGVKMRDLILTMFIISALSLVLLYPLNLLYWRLVGLI